MVLRKGSGLEFHLLEWDSDWAPDLHVGDSGDGEYVQLQEHGRQSRPAGAMATASQFF